MKTKLYNQKAEMIGEIELPEKIFAAKWNPALVHQVVVAQEANRRKVIAHTKGRGEVRGGGRKPWKQKGTGRSRQGSIRSPLWKGGGVTFGPTKERVFTKGVNKKAKRLAMFSALSKKFSDNQIKVVDDIKISEAKTKLMAQILEKFFQKGKKNGGLIILAQSNPILIHATRNLSFGQITTVSSLNLEDILKYKYLLFFKESIPVIESTFKI